MLAGAGTILAVAGTVLWRRLGPVPLRLPVLGYAALVTAMGAAAVRSGLRTPGPAGRALVAGGGLFVLSDALVAATIVDPRPHPVTETAVMVTYAAAQGLLATALATPA